MKDGVSIIMPAYNEEKNLPLAVKNASQSLTLLRCPYEIIIVNDGSKDNTEKVAEALSAKYKTVKVLQNSVNRGLGFSLSRGISIATMPYVTLYPSDNEMEQVSFQEIIKLRKHADLISSYMANPWARSLDRRIVSKLFVVFVNFVFGLSLRYYTGPFIAKSILLKKAHLKSDGVTILTELRVKLIKSGARFLEIPFIFTMRKHGKATLFRRKTFAQTFATIAILLRNKSYT